MNINEKKSVYILILYKWDDEEGAIISTYKSDTTYDLVQKESLKKLAVDSVNYLARGYKIELISIRYDFISMVSNYEILYMGYTNRQGEYHEFNISDITFPSEEYGCDYFDAYCIDEDGVPEGIERSFKVERVDFIKQSDFLIK